jgi:tetratricopeptide (TPR) repeat protein
MILTSACRCFAGRLRVFYGCPVLLLFIAATVSAQIGQSGIDSDPTSGMRRGTNTVVGQVFYPNGQQVDRRYTVRLSSVSVGEFSTMTDDNGTFTFRRLREGTYFITVEAGKDYLPATETVDFYDNRGRTNTIQLQLKAKPNTLKAGVVNAALAGVPREALQLYNQALASAAANDPKKAIEQFNAAINIHPGFVLALNELSILYIYLGDREKAADALTRATKAAPDNFTLRLNLGYLLMQMNKFAEAEIELHHATDLSTNSSLAHLYRGRILVSLHRYEEAEKELRRVISLNDVHAAMGYRYLGALYNETGDKSHAIESLEKYLVLSPKAKDIDDVKIIIKQLKDEITKSAK